MSLVTQTLLATTAPHCDAATLAPCLDAAATARLINTPLRVAHFLAQVHVETAGFTAFEENLNYSPPRLMAVWPKRFPTLQAALPYAHAPQALADLVYGGRMGNNAPNDGWTYRGRGAGLTGKDNYAHIGNLIGVDLVSDPDLASTPPVFAEAAACFWQTHNLNPLADNDDIAGVTEVWNGGLTGLSDRKNALALYKTAIGVAA